MHKTELEGAGFCNSEYILRGFVPCCHPRNIKRYLTAAVVLPWSWSDGFYSFQESN
jgi:hypothetical protein